MNSKNYRKVPKAIINDVKNIKSDQIIVGTVLEFSVRD
jgi:hypothetical protein